MAACSVCRGKARKPVVTRHCGHLFCEACLQGWLQAQRPFHTCPTCRCFIPSSPSSPPSPGQPFMNPLVRISCNAESPDLEAGSDYTSCVQCWRREACEPVVLSRCGHLLCWSCLWALMQHQIREQMWRGSSTDGPSFRCPMCSIAFTEEDLTPVYIGDHKADATAQQTEPESLRVSIQNLLLNTNRTSSCSQGVVADAEMRPMAEEEEKLAEAYATTEARAAPIDDTLIAHTALSCVPARPRPIPAMSLMWRHHIERRGNLPRQHESGMADISAVEIPVLDDTMQDSTNLIRFFHRHPRNNISDMIRHHAPENTNMVGNITNLMNFFHHSFEHHPNLNIHPSELQLRGDLNNDTIPHHPRNTTPATNDAPTSEAGRDELRHRHRRVFDDLMTYFLWSNIGTDHEHDDPNRTQHENMNATVQNRDLDMSTDQNETGSRSNTQQDLTDLRLLDQDLGAGATHGNDVIAGDILRLMRTYEDLETPDPEGLAAQERTGDEGEDDLEGLSESMHSSDIIEGNSIIESDDGMDAINNEVANVF